MHQIEQNLGNKLPLARQRSIYVAQMQVMSVEEEEEQKKKLVDEQ